VRAALGAPKPACVTADVKKPGSPDGPDSPGGPASPTRFDLRAAAKRLRGLSTDELRSRFRLAFNLTPTVARGNSRDNLIRRLLYAEQEKHRRDARDRDWHRGIALGTHCILNCERCGAGRIVAISTRKKLLRLSQQGRRPKFLCADCRDRYSRRAGERAALAKTVADIKRKKEGRG